MMSVDWVLRHKLLAVLIALAVAVLLWFVLRGYIQPENATNRKDVVQVFAIIIAGIVGVIGAAVGLSNVRIGRENLEHNRIALEKNLRIAQDNLEHNQQALREQLDHQRDLEDRRAQDSVLQAYYEQMGDLLTDHQLSTTDREDIKLLARAQTLTVAGRLDQNRKGQLLVFLYGAGLIARDQTVVDISGADFGAAGLIGANLSGANLSGANLSDANLRSTDLRSASLKNTYLKNADLWIANLIGANLSGATLWDAKLSGADLIGADLSGANLWDVYLIGADLSGANLKDANIGFRVGFGLRGRGASLSNAKLNGADLSGAKLWGADLSGADLSDAIVTEEQLAACKSLEGAIMPNGQKYEAWINTKNS